MMMGGAGNVHDELCPTCAPSAECPASFEKVLDFKNVGLITYRRSGKRVSRDKSGRNMDALIVHNSSDSDITSEDILREMHKREITCQRCRQIIERALQLLTKVPAINKKSILGICHHCKLKDPCHDCKETTKSFLSNYKAKARKEQMTKRRLSIFEKVAKDPPMGKKTVKHYRTSESAVRLEELLRLGHPKAERELEIHDLCPQTSRYTNSLPVIGKSKKHLRPDQHFEKKPSSNLKITVSKDGKITFAPDNSHFSHLSDFDDHLGKKRYSRSTTQNKQRLKDKHTREASPDKESITTDDIILIEPQPVLQIQKRKYYKVDDTLPELSRLYTQERKQDNIRRDQKDPYLITVDDPYLIAIEKKYAEETKKTDGKHSDEALTGKKTFFEEISGFEKMQKNLQKGIKKPDLTSKSEEFTFSFPFENLETEKHTVRDKTSAELTDEIQDMLYIRDERKEIKRRNKEEIKRRKQVATVAKTKAISEEKSYVEKLEEETQSIKQAKLDFIKEDTETQKSEQERKNYHETRLAAVNEMKITKTQKDLVPSKPKDATSDSDPTPPITQPEPKKTESDGTPIYQKEIERPKELKNKEIQFNAKDENKIQKERPLLKKEKEKSLFKDGKEKEKDLQSKQKEPEKNKLEEEKDIWKIRKISDKKQKQNKITVKVGTENKETQTPKLKHEFGLADMLKAKNELKRKDASQPARLQKKPANVDKQPKKTKDAIKSSHRIKVRLSKPLFKQELVSLNSTLEINADLKLKKHSPTEVMIKGQKIVNIKQVHHTFVKEKTPLLFATHHETPIADLGDNEKRLLENLEIPNTMDQGQTTDNGVTRYFLSDPTFIEKGWTVLPTEKIMRKMNVYRMRPAKPEFDWFKRNKKKHLLFYDSGERFAEYEKKGRCRWFYRNQRLALDHYDAEELNAQQRFVIYSNGEPDERGRTRPYTILATFDYLGNCVVFDHGGKIRLKYNQTEGVVLDSSIGPVSHWKWHTLNDPPELRQVMIDTQLAHKDPNIFAMGANIKLQEKPNLLDASFNDEMLAIEFENLVKEKMKKMNQDFKPFQIKMKALKINEHFSLKILDQTNVYLIYRDGTTNIKLNLGMLLDHKEIVDTVTVEVGEVANNLERFPACTDSLAALQKSVAYTQRYERTRTERERRIRRPAPSVSADKLTAAVSRPVRLPLRAFNSSTATSATQPTSCVMNRKPSSNNVYCSNCKTY